MAENGLLDRTLYKCIIIIAFVLGCVQEDRVEMPVSDLEYRCEWMYILESMLYTVRFYVM